MNYKFLRPKFLRKLNRQDFLSSITPNLSALEIGPFNNPLLKGKNVKYADYLDSYQLTQRAKELGLDSSLIPHIDYTLKKSPISQIKEDFDAVVSCHCIEHQPNLIKHLQDVYSLLQKKRGKYYLIIPDKRYCFDKNFSESTIAEIIDSFENNRSFHSLRNIIEHRALVSHNDSKLHWKEKHRVIRQAIDAKKIKDAILEWKQAQNSEIYIDVHAWYFTPESFIYLIDILYTLGYIKFSVEKIYYTQKNSNEFWVILSLID